MAPFSILHYDCFQTTAIPHFYQRGFLFNEARHISQQSDRPFHTIIAVNADTGQAEARYTFFLESTIATSPMAAPFGSIEFAENLPDFVLDEFLQTLLQTANDVGASTLRIVNYPHCYAPRQAVQLTKLLTERGFSITEMHENAYLPVTHESFEQTIVAAERRRLRKCQRADFQFKQWTNPDIDLVTAFIIETRRLQDYQLSLSAERLASLLHLFPDEFGVFVVNDQSRIIALSVVVRVRGDILYNFLPVSHPDYRTFSPMVMLIDGLFTYCQQEGIRLLDLGVSLDGTNQPKPSLIRFKQNLGAQVSPKLTFEKSL